MRTSLTDDGIRITALALQSSAFPIKTNGSPTAEIARDAEVRAVA